MTLRSLVIGAGLSLVIGVGVPYGAFVIMGSHMSSLNAPAAFFLFFLWVGVVQVLLGLIHGRLVLGKGELLTIYLMMVVATAFSGGERNGFCLMLLGSAAGVFYLASPQNEWAERVHPYVADWMVPHDEMGIQWFFEGMPEGESLPWGMWLPPLFWWLLFMVALWMVSICAMVILRRQWVEHEHLIYPITKVPLAMVEAPSGGSLVAPFFKKPLMWVGLLLAFGRESLNALNHYFPFVPVIPPNFGDIILLRGTVGISFYLNLMILGFAYFLKPDVMLGMWVFTLLRQLEEGALHLTGAGIGEPVSGYGGGLLAHQSIGAMTALVLFGLWIARGHLREVFRKAFRGDTSVDDADEIMSYRTAVWGVILGLVGMNVWLWRAGLPLWVGPLFLFGALVTFISLTRIIDRGGLADGVSAQYPPRLRDLGDRRALHRAYRDRGAGADGDMDGITGEHDDGAYGHGVEVERGDRASEAMVVAGDCDRYWDFCGQHVLDVVVGNLSGGGYQRSWLRDLSARLYLGVCGTQGRRECGTELVGLARQAAGRRGDGESPDLASPFPVVAFASSGICGQYG